MYGSFDYFYYATKGFLYAPDALDVGYTDPLGVSLPKISTDGEHRRAGVEFQLGWRDDIGDFHYDVALILQNLMSYGLTTRPSHLKIRKILTSVQPSNGDMPVSIMRIWAFIRMQMMYITVCNVQVPTH